MGKVRNGKEKMENNKGIRKKNRLQKVQTFEKWMIEKDSEIRTIIQENLYASQKKGRKKRLRIQKRKGWKKVRDNRGTKNIIKRLDYWQTVQKKKNR